MDGSGSSEQNVTYDHYFYC